MNVLEKIQNHTFVGNAYHDSEMFGVIHKYVCNTSNTTADKAEALRILTDRGMGCGRDEHLSDAEIVAGYLSCL